MTPARAIELAMAETIKRYAEIGTGTNIRAWMSMAFGGLIKGDTDMNFPMIDVRASPPQTDENQSTMWSDLTIICATWIDDDEDHKVITGIYEAVQELVDTLFSQFRNGQTAGAEYAFFNSKVAEYTDVIASSCMSFTIGDSLSPFEDTGKQAVGIGLRCHYGRTDF